MLDAEILAEVEDSKKYSATGGYRFADYKDGKPCDKALKPLLSLLRNLSHARAPPPFTVKP